MKKVLFTLSLLLLALTTTARSMPWLGTPYKLPTSTLRGDVNGDGAVTITDVTMIVEYVMGHQSDDFIIANADVNGDGSITITDVAEAVNIILEGSSHNPAGCPDNNHPHMIDLGLPSGTKWSCCNVGADAPEELGELHRLHIDDNINYTYDKADGGKQTPDITQIAEILDNCTIEWVNNNGVDGAKITGPNGSYVFMPTMTNNYTGCLAADVETDKWNSYFDHWYLQINSVGTKLTTYGQSGLVSEIPIRLVKGAGNVRIADFNQSGSSYKENGFTYKGETYSYRYSCDITVELTDDTDVEDWGYVYEDISGEATKFSLKGQSSPCKDSRLVCYRNEKISFVTIYEYVKYKDDDVVYYNKSKEYSVIQLCPDDNHPHMIDLGLPSGTRWSCCNVDAHSPKENGNFFSWGDLEAVSNFSHQLDELNHYDEQNDPASICGTDRDAAFVNWGKPWKTPSTGQMNELKDHCSFTRIDCEPYFGIVMTGPNGNQTFLPASGIYSFDDYPGYSQEEYYWNETGANTNKDGFYWSGDKYDYVSFHDNGLQVNEDGSPLDGMPIRPCALYVPTFYPSDPLLIKAGGTSDLTVSLDYIEEDIYNGLQFDLSLPTGFHLAKDKYGYFYELADRYTDNMEVAFNDFGSGHYRVLVYSLNSAMLKDAMGDVISLTIEADKNITAGSYEGVVTKFRLSTRDNKGVDLPDSVFTIIVNNYAPGDVNHDGDVNVTDVMMTANKCLGNEVPGFYFTEADINNDGDVNVTDVMGIVNIVLGWGRNAMPSMYETSNGQLVVKTSSKGCSLSLDNSETCTALQMVVTLPYGSSLKDMSLNGNSSHQVNFQRIGDNSNQYKVIVWSADGATLGNTNKFLSLQVKGNKEVTISDILLTNEKYNTLVLPVAGKATSIGEKTHP
ncbi:MAG: dockerin type I repeat-containing protein [Prevotella sp.]|nr:dockerin type I repeat-containing protein [Prevotella sp.]